MAVLEHNFDLRLKAHIQYSIGLVKHHVGHSSQVGNLAVRDGQNFPHPTRSTDDDLAASLESRQLVLHRDASVDWNHAQITCLCEGPRLLVDLKHQLSGWSYHETNRAIHSFFHWPLVSNVPQHWQDVSQGLSTSSFCDANQIST